jgi:hypothetical protein
MEQFQPTFLYVKTHNKTGLKYFGKTKHDPHKYKGSGLYWLRHIKEHGYDVSTEIIGFYTDKQECKGAATLFSTVNQIVESDNWANLIDENGLDGGATKFGPLSEETKRKISSSHLGITHTDETKQKIKDKRAIQNMDHMRVPKSEEHKKKISDSLKGRTQSEETIKKRADKLRGRERSEETKRKISESQRGKIISDETRLKMSKKTISDEHKQALRDLYTGKIWTEEEKEKLKGMVPVVDKLGNNLKITKEEYYKQLGKDCEYVHVRSKEALNRKSNAVPIFKQEDAEDLAKMRR